MLSPALPIALLAIGFWSSNAVVARFALEVLPVQQIQLLQFLGAGCVIALYHGWSCAWQKRGRIAAVSATPLATPLLGVIIGSLGLVGTMMFQYLSFAIGPLAQVNLVAYAWPLLATLIIVIGRTLPFILVNTGLSLIGFVGVGLIMGFNLSTEFSTDFTQNTLYGFIFALLSAMCMALFSVYVNRAQITMSHVLGPASVMGITLSGAWLVLAHVLWGQDIWVWSWMIGAAFYLGCFPMGAGYILWVLAARRMQRASLAMLGYVTPLLSTSLLGLVGEPVSQSTMWGGLLVCAACLASHIAQARWVIRV